MQQFWLFPHTPLGQVLFYFVLFLFTFFSFHLVLLIHNVCLLATVTMISYIHVDEGIRCRDVVASPPTVRGRHALELHHVVQPA